MASQLIVRSIAELRGECPLYVGSGVNQHRWVTDADLGQDLDGEIHFYTLTQGYDEMCPEAPAEDVFCRYCGILAVE